MKIFISIFAALVAMAATAQTDTENVEIVRPVASAYTLEVGSSHITDTYLSPLKYNGLSAAVGYERSQAMKFCPEKWVMQLRLTAGMDYTENPAKNVNIWGFGLASTWGMMRKFRNVWQEGMHIYAGGSTSLNLGTLYSTRNGNNPVSAKASWTVNATAMAVYSLKIKSLPVTLRYQPTLPLCGIFFSPEYDQLYYEIYKGDTNGTVNFAQPFSYFYMDNLLTADLRFGGTTLRLGYHGTVLSTEVHHIVCNMTTHNFLIGIANEWVTLSPRKKISDSAKVISSIY